MVWPAYFLRLWLLIQTLFLWSGPPRWLSVVLMLLYIQYIITSPLLQVDQWNICIICIPRKRRMETNLSKEESVYKQHCIFPSSNCSTAVPCPLCRCQRSEIQDRNKSWGFGVRCRSMHCWTPLEGTLSRALKECHEEWSNIPVVQIHISLSGFHCIEIICSGWGCAMAHITFRRPLIMEAQVWSPTGQWEISDAQNGTGTGFCLSILVFPSQSQSTSSLYWFVYVPWTVYNLSNW